MTRDQLGRADKEADIVRRLHRDVDVADLHAKIPSNRFQK